MTSSLTIGQVEVDESCHLGFALHEAGIGVDEQRAGERVRVVFGGLGGGGNAIDRESLEQVLVLVVVGEAEVADGVGRAFDTLDEDVIVFGELGVGGVEDGFLALAFIGVART